MPSGDHTGPTGQGPMTGRAAGYCAGSNQPGWINQMLSGWMRRGPGGGRGGGGGGRGHRHWFRATGMPGWQRAAMNLAAWGAETLAAAPANRSDIPREQQLAELKQQVGQLETTLEQARKRMEELSKADPQ